ncbi:unnamed protein product [Agarophyton chilense]
MIRRLSLDSCHLLARTLLLTNYELIVSKTLELLIRGGCDEIKVHLNPTALRFTISASKAPSHLPLDLLEVLSAQCSIEYRAKDWAVHMRGSNVLEERTDTTINQGCELDVWEMFYAVPVRRRLQQARDYLELINATRDSMLPIVFANPTIRISAQTKNHIEVLSWIGDGLTIDAIQAALGTIDLSFVAVRLRCQDKLVTGFISRLGCSNCRAQYAALDGDSGVDWLSNIAKLAWKKFLNCRSSLSRRTINEKHYKIGRYPAFILHCCTIEERKDQDSTKNRAAELKREIQKELVTALFHVLAGTKDKKMEWSKDNYMVRKKRTNVLKRPRFEETKLLTRIGPPPIPLRRVQLWSKSANSPLSEHIFEQHVKAWSNLAFKNSATAGLQGGVWEQKSMSIDKKRLRRVHVVGQVDRKFIVVADESALYAIDQHAASERDLFERFLRKAKQEINFVDCRENIALSRERKEIAMRHSKVMHRWGWKLNFIEEEVVITSTPRVCDVLMTKNHLLELLDEIYENDQVIIAGAVPRFVRRTVATIACHKAVRFGDCLSLEQCENVLHALSKCDNPFCCAHGRPSIVPLAAF